MVTRNRCLRLPGIGHRSLIGAGNTITDFSILAKSVRPRGGGVRMTGVSSMGKAITFSVGGGERLHSVQCPR